jgi:hypothetical protein
MIHKIGRLKTREIVRFIALNDDGMTYYFELSPKGNIVGAPSPPIPRRPHQPSSQPVIPNFGPPRRQERQPTRRGQGNIEFLGLLDVEKLNPTFPFSISAILNPLPKPLVTVR